MRAEERWGFNNPFPRNGCVPIALAHAAGRDGEFAASLASWARGLGLYGPNGMARFRGHEGVWLSEACLRLLHRDFFVRGSLARFIRTHTAGTWLVHTGEHTRGHLLAVIDGEPFGVYHLRAHVDDVLRVERVANTCSPLTPPVPSPILGS